MSRRPRFQIPDFPRDRPNVPTVKALVRRYYAKPGHSAGGNCHVVLDDGNVDNGCLRWTLDYCEKALDEDGAMIVRSLLQMTGTQRRKVCR